MRNILTYFFFPIVIIFIITQLFIYSSLVSSDNDLHYTNFISKYAIFSINKPEYLDFAGEETPIYSNEIWEKYDKAILKNTYWQSNTLLYLKKSNKYFHIIEPILAKNNIPDDFKYLSLIESGFENVISPAGAAGFWQLLKGTARDYGLEVNSSIDERYNLEKSTQAACEYLRKSYDKFGSWTMAAAAYNMGQNGLMRAVNKQSTNNYYNLYLNQETRQYVFRILAVKEILENPLDFGFIYREKDLYSSKEYEIIEVDSTISDLYLFALNQGINYKILKEFNPWLLSSSLPDESRRKYQIKIPTMRDSLIFKEVAR